MLLSVRRQGVGGREACESVDVDMCEESSRYLRQL